MTSVPSRTEILDDIIAILSEQTGVSFAGAINEETRFFADLGLASIDAVVLTETLQKHYGRTLPFTSSSPRSAAGPSATSRSENWSNSWRPTFKSETPAMPKLVANGIDFHYQQAGAGPDVVLIHGVTGDLSIWFLCEAMGILGRSFRVTAFDLRGHGYSGLPKDGYTSADQAGDCLAIMDALDIEHAMLVGHSFGAVIATHAAVLFPDRVDAIVLSDPCFPALRHLEDVSRWGHWQNFRQEAADAGVTLSDEHWYDLGRFFDQVLHLDGERLLRFRQAVGLPGFNRLLRLAETTCGNDAKVPAGLTEELIQSVTQPVLAHLRRAFPVPGDVRLSAPSICPIASPARSRAPSTAPPRKTAPSSSRSSTSFLIANSSPAHHGEGDTMIAKPTVLVTGAAHGIGRATAIALARKGMPLGLIDRDAAALAELAQTLKNDGATPVATAVVDVTDRDSLFAAVEPSLGRARAVRRPGRMRRNRHAHAGARARHVDACARRSKSTWSASPSRSRPSCRQ